VEAEKARRHGAEVEQLYAVAQRLLLVSPDQIGNAPMLKALLEVSRAKAVCLFEANTAEVVLEGDSLHNLAARTREAYVLGRDADDLGAAVSVRCLRIGATTVGAIGFEGLSQREALYAAFSVLAAAALERTESFRRASHEAAATQVEIFRTAILDALAHEFKTPLATILALIGGLRESPRLEPTQVEMADMIEDEVSRLDRLTNRLLRTARLDREELKPQIKGVDVARLVRRLVGRYNDQSSERLVSISSDGQPFEAPVDRQLLDLALTQLVDNAFKYSPPGAAITVDLRRENDFIVITVANEGSSIAPQERERIFERFYRGTNARSLTSGTGLGLYVARKIAAAHGGQLELARGSSCDGAVFYLKLPAPECLPNAR
jgi:two-component system sensor histidine kinase KdpD